MVQPTEVFRGDLDFLEALQIQLLASSPLRWLERLQGSSILPEAPRGLAGAHPESPLRPTSTVVDLDAVRRAQSAGVPPRSVGR
jgi:hypothetical protein